MLLTGGFSWIFFMYFIQHCFVCCPSDFTLSEDAGIEPRAVATSALKSDALTTRLFSSTSKLDVIHKTRLDLNRTRLDLIHTRLHLILIRLDLIHNSARSHPRSATSHPHSARPHRLDNLAKSHPHPNFLPPLCTYHGRL